MVNLDMQVDSCLCCVQEYERADQALTEFRSTALFAEILMASNAPVAGIAVIAIMLVAGACLVSADPRAISATSWRGRGKLHFLNSMPLEPIYDRGG